MKLILCAGSRHEQGWVHHDVKQLEGIDIACDLHDIPKHVTEGTCTHIQFTHALEHFPTKETVPILTMLRSLLVPGGELYIEVPNFAWHARLVAEGREAEAVYYAFGGQLDEWDFHKTGFTPKLLQEALEEAGYTNIQIFDQTSISAKAYA
jgi:hypothetical protein